MNLPDNIKFAKSHEWLRVEGEIGIVGISEFASTNLGDIVFIEMETEGETLDRGEAIGSIEAVKTVSDFYAPVSGEVVEVNQAVLDDPSLVNSDCYGEGWLAKIKISNASEIDDLLDANGYNEIINE